MSAFGLADHNVVSSVSTASFDSDFQHGQVFYYQGPHGVTINADLPAFDAFLARLVERVPDKLSGRAVLPILAVIVGGVR